MASSTSCFVRSPRAIWHDTNTKPTSEVILQIRELVDDNQLTRAVTDLFPLQLPRTRMRYEYGIQSAFQRRVDIRLRAVADHPGALRLQAELGHQPGVSGAVFLFHDRGMGEITAQTGAIQFELLLVGVALGEQRQLVAG